MPLEASFGLGGPHHGFANNQNDSAHTGKSTLLDPIVGAHLTVGAAELQTRSEPFESFKFTPNAIAAFYPKCIQKLLARK